MMDQLFYWGEGGQYGPYHAQANGWPNTGEVMRDFREQKAMSAEELGEVYGRATTKTTSQSVRDGSTKWKQKMMCQPILSVAVS